MGNRAFHAVVVLLWASTTGWLVVAKVLPPLLVGEPPTYRSTLQEQHRVIAWRLEWNGQPIGWSASKVLPAEDGVTEVHSRMLLDDLPLKEMSPYWLRPLLAQLGTMDMDARSRVEIDPLGALSHFRSTVRIGEIADAVRVRGHVDGSQLHVEVRSGEFQYKKQLPLPPDALVGNELTPQAELPGLRVGQSWTMPVYSPFYPNQPLEIWQASVDEEGMLQWNDEMVTTRIVSYRADSGAALGASTKPRGRLWVARDGRVLQQESMLLNSQLRFVRMTSDETEALLASLGEDWLSASARPSATAATEPVEANARAAEASIPPQG